MATVEILDYRRTDLRTNILENPFWITSAEILLDADDLSALLFSFPITASAFSPGYPGSVLIHEIGVQVTTNWAGGTVAMDVGSVTLATDAVTTGGVSTTVDADEYVPTADVTHGTAGVYWPDGGDWFTARQANIWGAPAIIVPADTTVPGINATLTSDDTITAGGSRVIALISILPTVAEL